MQNNENNKNIINNPTNNENKNQSNNQNNFNNRNLRPNGFDPNKQFKKNINSQNPVKQEIKTSIVGVKPEEEPDYTKSKKAKTTLEYNNKRDSTYIFAMGGLEEIGKNTYAIEHNEETIIVDAGIKFATSDLLGVNGLIPNFEYFRKNNRPIDKLIITHGHEDHIGGIPYLLQEVEVKEICASLIASELIKRRLGEFKNITQQPIITVFSDDTVLHSKYFKFDFFRVCHSIPDCFGVCIESPNGIVVSAGDYRFDFGKDTDDTNIHKMVEISNRGVDLFLGESTNSDQPGFSETEDNIINNVETLIKNATGRVFVATFASNLGRIEKIIERAINLNRKICVMGRSMESNIKTSRKIGYLKLSETDFISSKEISSTPDENILVVLTGSQGEEMAALNLMAEGKYAKVTLKPSDTIIMSSNPIPGNFKSVETLVNKLFKQGVNVIQNSPSFKIHASGHATTQEQQMMIKVLRPKNIMPIHGESKMLRSLKANSANIGMKPENVHIVTNGQKAELKDRKITVTNDIIDACAVLIDKKIASKNTIELVEDRKLLSEEGVFNALICLDRKNKKLYKNPMLTTRGCFYAKESSALISKMSYSIKEELEKKLNENQNLNKEEIKEVVKKIINYYVWKNKKKNPVVTLSVFEQ